MVAVNRAEDGGQLPAVPLAVMMKDPAARLFALTRLVAALESSDPELLSQMVGAGITPELMDRLRQMPLAEACHFALGQCGVSIAIDSTQIRAQFSRMDRARSDREMLEYLIRNGASPVLLTRLFSLSPSDARKMRRALMPDSIGGGRPRIPDPVRHAAIEAEWSKLSTEISCPRARMRALHERFADLQIASLELVVMPQPTWVSSTCND